MSFEEQWWGSGTSPLNPAGPNSGGGDPGDPIGDSLRFRPGSILRLARPAVGSNTNWTFSVWIKTSLSVNQQIFHCGKPSDSNTTGVRWGTDGRFTEYLNSGSASGKYSPDYFRDPSAWYHFMWTFEAGESWKYFINGVDVSGTNRPTYADGFSLAGDTYELTLGGLARNGGLSDCYMAQAYFFDGLTLTPESFGRVNANGVWVPRNALKADLTTPVETADYGNNGFHLTFDPQQDSDPMVAIGMDSSGNDNHFTAEGFNTQVPGIWSPGLSASADNTYQADPANRTAAVSRPEQAFNGVDTNGAYTDSINQYLYWVSPFPLTNVNSLRIGNANAPLNIKGVRINGVDTGLDFPNPGAYEYVDVSSAIPDDGIITEIAFFGDGGLNTQLNRIEVNGQVLVDNPGTTYDLMLDSPTQNWMTGNPLDVAGTIARTPTFSDGNLRAVTTASKGIGLGATTQHIEVDDPSTYYAELTIVTSSRFAISIVGQQSDLNNFWNGDGGDAFTTGLGNARQFTNQGTLLSSYWTGANAATYGMLYDNSTRRVKFFRNGDPVVYAGPNDDRDDDGGWLIPADWGTVQFIVSNQGADQDGFNFGQRPFLHQPAGSTTLQTQNLPEATIPDGREHFQTILGPGQGADSGVAGQRGGDWSSYIFFTPAGQEPDFNSTTPNPSVDSPSAQGFDGNLTTIMGSGHQGASILFRPETPIEATVSLRVYMNPSGASGVQQTIYVNSNQVITNKGYSAAGWEDLSGLLTFPLSIENIAWLSGNPSLAGGYVSAIEVDGEILVDANILALAQQTFPNGLWWIKDRVNANQHQLLDSVRGTTSNTAAIRCPSINPDATTYTAPTGDSVAWCWNASDPDTNGFNILTWTGDDVDGRTIAHGLPDKPDLILCVNLTANNTGKLVWSSELADTLWLALHLSLPATAFPGGFITADATNLTLNFSGSVFGNANSLNDEFVAYAWTAIPGYSAFGTYVGNNTADGPFIYTGFKPAFVLIKCTTGDHPWNIWDNARNTHNPNSTALFPNRDVAELATYDIDFLSNGFKPRKFDYNFNSTKTYIYAAFAEHPFQSPATAR